MTVLTDVLLRERREPTAAAVLLLCIVFAVTVAGCAAAPESRHAELTNAVTWSTASESDNFGFDVYRAKERGGAYVRITSQPLEGGGTTDVPRGYHFVDDDIEPGQEYFYFVESISLSGERKRFTPVMRAPPKYPADH